MKKTFRIFFFKNLTSFLIPMLIPLVILGSLYPIVVQRYIKEEISRNNYSILYQYKENIELIFSELDSLIVTFLSNRDNLSGLTEALQEDHGKNHPIMNEFKEIITRPTNARPYAHSIYFYADNPNHRFISAQTGYEDLNTYPDNSWYQSYLLHRENEKAWTELREITRFDVKNNLYPTKILTLYRNTFTTQYNKSDGVIVLNVLPSYIQNQLYGLHLASDQSIMIMDENQNIIFQNEEFAYSKTLDYNTIFQTDKALFDVKSGGQSYTIAKLTSRLYGWTFVSLIPHSTLYKVPSILVTYTLIALILSIIIGIAVAIFLTKKNYRDLRNIISIIDSTEENLPILQLSNQTKNIYGYIIHRIIRNFMEQSLLKVQLSERKYKLQAMELRALQSQLNPHFLFNTLESIYWKVASLTGKPNVANQMLKYLADVLKYSFFNPLKSALLDHEINNTISYINIQKFRYKDKFEVLWEIDDNIRHFMLPKLLLQPIIENSIYHGIKEKPGMSLIKIKITRSHSSLLMIRIIDNGLGMTKDKLKNVLEMLNRDENELSENTDHIGLYNTNKRLILTYGEANGLKIKSKSGWGTVVVISISI